MTHDQYRREGAEAMREVAAEVCIADDFFPDRNQETLALSEMREAIAALAQSNGEDR